jgi:hypothetical protein
MILFTGIGRRGGARRACAGPFMAWNLTPCTAALNGYVDARRDEVERT